MINAEHVGKLHTWTGTDKPTAIPRCSNCWDTKHAKTRIWIEAMVDHAWSDFGESQMPRVDLPCRMCNESQYNAEYKKAELAETEKHKNTQ